MDIRIQQEQFDLGQEINAFTARQAGMGAVVSFSGIVRNVQDGLHHMQIEHYPGMTESATRAIADEAYARWTLGDVLVIHRYGQLAPGEQIMMVATSAPHRKHAFEAAEFLMDFLKSRAPFWKKEVTMQSSNWVEAKDDDEDALGRWD